MLAFRALLVLILAIIGIYTAIVVANHGLVLFQVFFADIAELAWPGQFNLDFMLMLLLSGLWVAWRNRFSGGGLALAVVAFFFGAPFLCVYLLVLSAQCRGDVAAMLVGPDRAASKSVT